MLSYFLMQEITASNVLCGKKVPFPLTISLQSLCGKKMGKMTIGAGFALSIGPILFLFFLTLQTSWQTQMVTQKNPWTSSQWSFRMKRQKLLFWISTQSVEGIITYFIYNSSHFKTCNLMFILHPFPQMILQVSPRSQRTTCSARPPRWPTRRKALLWNLWSSCVGPYISYILVILVTPSKPCLNNSPQHVAGGLPSPARGFRHAHSAL